MNKRHQLVTVIRSENRTSPDGLVVSRWNYVQRGLYAGWEFDEVLSMRKPRAVAKEAKVVRGRPVESVPKVAQATTKARANAIIKRAKELENHAASVPSKQNAPSIVLEQGIRKLQKVALLPNPECQLNRKAAKRLAARKKDWSLTMSSAKNIPMGSFTCPGSLQ